MTAPTLAELISAVTASVDWRHQASCREEDPELFFPTGTSDPAQFQAEEAKSVCRRCPVRERCLQWAHKAYIADGIWGGHTPKEREALRRRAARQKQPAAGTKPTPEPARASPQQ